jgi:pyruvate,orthophosphate dikinase
MPQSEANAKQISAQKKIFSAEHRWFLELSSSFFGIHRRTINFLNEFYRFIPNLKLLNEQLREIALNDIWFYKSHQEAGKALKIIVNLFKNFLNKGLDYHNKERALKTLLEFVKLLYENKNAKIDFPSLITEAINILEKTLNDDKEIIIRASSFLKIIPTPLAHDKIYSTKLKFLFQKSLQKNLDFWKNNLDFKDWRDKENKIFDKDYYTSVSKKEKQVISEMQKKLATAKNWEDLKKVLNFNGFTDKLRDFIMETRPGLERIYFIFYLLRLPGMVGLRDFLIIDLTQAFKSFSKEKFTEIDIDIFLTQTFSLFRRLKSEHTEKILECILNLGEKIYQTQDKLKIDIFINHLIEFGFIYPKVLGIDQEWQTQVDQNHLKNIRVWLELIEYSPKSSRKLIAALIVNLKIGGIFICDNDLFQRDISKLLNSNFEPCYILIKQLAYLFPVYFNNIGAEGKIREITTSLDKLSYRNDRLIHFLRKQTHSESNNTHIELAKRILFFWYNGNPQPLLKYLPLDVQSELKASGKWFDPVHKIVQKLCEKMQIGPEDLLKKDIEEIEINIKGIKKTDVANTKRVMYLIELYALLKHKYTLDPKDVINDLKKISFLSFKEVESLERHLKEERYATSIKQIFSIISHLKGIILDPKESEAHEDIYYKRHIAAGIPSMYGRYSELKFESLGIIFRLERLADFLINRLINQRNLDYMTIDGFHNAAKILELFKEGLKLNGISSENFNSNLEMLHYSFKTSTFSMDQFVNIFYFLTLNIKEIIENYYINPFNSLLKIIIPQYIKEVRKKDISETNQDYIIYKRSEEFYRDVISSAFLVQHLDNYISQILVTLRAMMEKLKPEVIHMLLNYDPKLLFTSFNQLTPKVDNQTFLGAKAHYLKKLFSYKFPVPPGFVLTTEWFRDRTAIKQFPEMYKAILGLIKDKVTELEKITKKKYGDPQNPLLLAVRSGTVISMPGAMDSILNIGMNDQIAESLSKLSGYGWAAWDSYRRLLQNWGMAHGIMRDEFDKIMVNFKELYKVKEKKTFSDKEMRTIAFSYKNLLDKHRVRFEECPFEQLIQAIIFVFQSWYNKRAQIYRKNLQIAEEWGTAVIVQEMVFGNINSESGTGVIFTKIPFEKSSEIVLYGDFSRRSQGEDIVSGLVHALPVSEFQNRKSPRLKGNSLEEQFPEIYQELLRLAKELVYKRGYEHQEIEFTFKSKSKKDLYILQTRNYNLQNKKTIPVFTDPAIHIHLVGTGIGIGRGAMNGIVAFNMKDLEMLAKKYPQKNKILIRPDTVPDDIAMIFECDGLLTARGGVTSHAAVTAAQLGKTCIVNCRQLIVMEKEKRCIINKTEFRTGDGIAIDAHLGNIYKGNYPISSEQINLF